MSIKYEICEINPGHHLKVLKCFSESNLKQIDKKNTLIVIIPGNPGIIEFYEHFAVQLNQKTNCPVVGISHTGHLYHDEISDWKPANVQNQINDKIKFIENHLFDFKIDDEKLYEFDDIILIGHSVGCYLILEILEQIAKEKKNLIKKCYLLFPTIERMSQTPNGKFLTFTTKFFLWFIYFFAYLISILPNNLQKYLVNCVFDKSHPNADVHMVDNIKEIVFNMSTNYSCVRSCFHMGADEMNVVNKLNKSSIENNLDLIYLYYGTSDKWCPVSYYHDMKNFINEFSSLENNEKILALDKDGLEHAFVIYKQQCDTISNIINKNFN